MIHEVGTNAFLVSAVSVFSVSPSEPRFPHQAPVVQKLDNAIHRINRYPADSLVCFVTIYPLDSDFSGG